MECTPPSGRQVDPRRTLMPPSDLSIKVLFGRQRCERWDIGKPVEDGLNWPVPDYSTLCRRGTVTIQIPIGAQASPPSGGQHQE